MRAHKRTIFFCIVLAIFAFGFTIFFNILDQKTNSIFYDTFLAIFTGLIISIVTSYTFYQNEKNKFAENLHLQLVLIYQNLAILKNCSNNMIIAYDSKTLFSNKTLIGKPEIMASLIISAKENIPIHEYVDLFGFKKNKSKVVLQLEELNHRLEELYRLKKLSTLIQTQAAQKEQYELSRQHIIQDIKINSTSNEDFQQKLASDYNYNTLYPLNIENCENIVLSCISRIEELSSQLCNSIEDKIFILEKLLKFESKWEDDKKNIMNQVSLINEHLK